VSPARPGQGQEGSRDAALALLATDLSGLAERVGELAARVETAEAAIQGQARTVAEAASLAQEVTRLSETLAAAGGGDAGGPGADPLAHPRVWAEMGDKDSVEALRDLARWVADILLSRYPHVGVVLAPCWPAHNAVVEELDWLYWDWTSWAASPQGRSRDAADWHDRWLPGVLARIGPLLEACVRKGDHAKPSYVRAVPERLQDPDYAPEQLFIEEMGRTQRAEGAGGSQPAAPE
jgi:hypothetical protein